MNIDPTEFVELMNQMTSEEQNKYLKMSKKCNKKNKDVCEMIYQMNLCWKKNSISDYYVLWRTDLEPLP